jgi:hypothetical protein
MGAGRDLKEARPAFLELEQALELFVRDASKRRSR